MKTNELRYIMGQDYEDLDLAITKLAGIGVGDIANNIATALRFYTAYNGGGEVFKPETILGEAQKEGMVIELLHLLANLEKKYNGLLNLPVLNE